MVKVSAFWILLFVSAICQAQTPNPQLIKEWHFPLPGGEASARLVHGGGDAVVLSMRNSTCATCPSIQESAEILRQVVQQMPGLRIDPHRLSLILISIHDPNAKRSLAAAALKSSEWQKCAHIKGCSGNGTVVKLINEARVFQPLNDVLAKYGLLATAGSAENIVLERASTVLGNTVALKKEADIRVPGDADLELIVSGK